MDHRGNLTFIVYYEFITGQGTHVRYVLGKTDMLLGLYQGIPTMFKAEIAMVPLLHSPNLWL